ncbi:protein of unknown function [Streptomyces sp. KY75]|nr:protein of unknown function [Streptomyces sp. KY70]CAD5987210.1 protein of unknown function [Streptomyces sp. KY75]
MPDYSFRAVTTREFDELQHGYGPPSKHSESIIPSGPRLR